MEWLVSELFTMWKYSKMVVLTALTAAVYAAILIPFKGIPLVPGYTEFRPGNVIPVVFGLFFGPAGAWGSAFGNLIGDFFGTLGLGSIAGFVGNFCYGLVGYKIWGQMGPLSSKREPYVGSWRQFVEYALVTILASSICAAFIAWGLEVFKLLPFAFLGSIIALNNAVMALLLGPALSRILYPRVRKWDLLWTDVMHPADRTPGIAPPLGVLFMWLGGLGGLAVGLSISCGLYDARAFQFGQQLGPMVVVAVCPFIVLFFVGAFLASGSRFPRPLLGLDEAAAPAPTAESAFAVAADEVRFTYRDSERPALRGVNLDLRPGEFVVLMGPSGAGKSTFCATLNGLIPHLIKGQLDGQVRVRGVAPAEHRVTSMSPMVGLLFQDFESQLFSTNVALEVAFGPENLGLPRDQIQKRVDRWLDFVALRGLEDRQPATLSGGQKQRLALASVLALEPDILCLDEPTTDLDPLGKEQVFAVAKRVRAERSGHTMLLVEHETAEALEADRVVLMVDGRVADAGPPRVIFQKVDELIQVGVQPPQVAEAFHRLGLRPLPLTCADALDRMRASGLRISPQKYAALLNKEEERRVRCGAEIIRVEGLRHSYGQSADAVAGVSLAIRRGEFVAILGQNGSGKTTLVKHFNGLLKPSAGKVMVEGRDAAAVPVSALGRTVGYVFQNPDHQIFAETVADEVAFGPRLAGLSRAEADTRVNEALEAVGLSEHRSHDPFLLTKGQRQRVAVASVLATKPQVIILDEPTTGLDYTEVRSMMDLVKRLNEAGHTIIIVTHSMWVAAEYAHRVILMDEGRVILDEPSRSAFAQVEKLRQAHLKQPQIVELSHRLGSVLLSVDEFFSCVGEV